ncbi:MAG: hypothetical protein B6229_10020 [Spirochaetaceae bacterium 4572_7]|nr:MAG: hypothetical protein B6229_10020 [Spirochaetaceae bacterium 4572_7]
MYFLRVESNFSAALYLLNCGEKYKGMHGHDYTVTVTLRSSTLSSCGVVFDYTKIQNSLDNLTAFYDSSLLNDNSDFLDQNPTVENVARIFCDKLLLDLPELPLFEVEVKELRGVSAVFRPIINA